MFPCFSQQNTVNGHHGDTVSVGHLPLGYASLWVSLAYCFHIRLPKFCAGMCLAPLNIVRPLMRPMIIAMRQSFRVLARRVTIASCHDARSERVLSVSLKRRVLKVAQAAISLNRIFVVYVMPVGTGANKRGHNQNVNIDALPLIIHGKGDGEVARTSRVTWFQDAASFALRRSAHAHYAPEIRDGIKALIANYGPPCFIRQFFGGKFLSSHVTSTQVAIWLGPFGCFNIRAARFAL